MGTRWLLNLVLLAAVAGLGAWLALAPDGEPAPEAATLTALDPGQVGRIRLEARDAPATVIVRDGGRWRLEAPWALPASEFKVMALLGLATALSHARLPADADALARYGLAPPRVVLALDDTRLAFGDTEALDGRRYVRVSDAVHLVTDRHWHHLTGGAAAFVHPAPLGPEPRIERIALPGLILSRGETGWRAEPAPEDASADAAARLAEAWRNAQAVAVEPWDPAVDGPPTQWVEVSPAGADAPLRFALLRGEDGVRLARPDLGLAWRFSAAMAGSLLALPAPAPGGADERP